MLSHLYNKHIGFVLLPGCHDADLVNMQVILSFHPRSRCYFIGLGDVGEGVPCQSGLGLAIDTNVMEFRQQLDVVVIVGHDEEQNENENAIEAIKKLSMKAKQVIAVGDGVLTLAKTGLLSNHRVRCAPSNTLLHKQLQPLVGEVVSCNLDNKNVKSDNVSGSDNNLDAPTVCESGKFVTAGPCTGAMEAAFLVLARLRGTFVASLAELSAEYAPTVRFPDTAPTKPDRPSQQQPPLKVGVLLPQLLFLPDVIGSLSVFKALPNCQVIGIVLEQEDISCAMGPTVAASVTNTCTLKDCPQLDVFLVGFTMPWVLSHSAIVEFVRNQAKGCKAMIGVCAGALLLGSAGLLEGKKATTNFQMKSLLPVVGASTPNETNDEKEEDLVVMDDDKFIYTAGPIIGAYEAAILVVAKLYGDGVAAYIEQSVLYYQHPHPLFNVGRANNATWGLLLAAKMPISPITPAFWFCARKRLAETHRHRAAKSGANSKATNNMTQIAVGAGILSAALVAHKSFTSPTMR